MIPEAVITAKNLTKRYNNFIAVNGIDFSISNAECFGFLGPNGAGKTSTMKMIYCLSPVTSGELIIAGMNPAREAINIKAMIGVVPQENNLDPELTVAENLIVYSRFFGIPYKEAKKRIYELVEFMSLEKKLEARIRELSGGMKRRLVMVRALLNNPKILILDEPTTGLDPQVRHLIWEKLRTLKESGVTMLLTTHYMEEASQLCDRLVIMDQGKILMEGNPIGLVERHTKRYVMEFGGNGDIDHIVQSYDCHCEKYGNRWYVFSDSEKILDTMSRQLRLQTRIIRNSTLEDLFLMLTGRGLNE